MTDFRLKGSSDRGVGLNRSGWNSKKVKRKLTPGTETWPLAGKNDNSLSFATENGLGWEVHTYIIIGNKKVEFLCLQL
jgi:hypothetical protein